MRQDRTWHSCGIQWLVLGLWLAMAGSSLAQEIKKSGSVVKVEAKAGSAGEDGLQNVTITLAIDKGWHIYANPVGFDDLASSQTTITLSSGKKLGNVRITYPEGKLVKDKVLGGEYKIYENKVTIKASFRREAGDTGPLEVATKFQACNASSCLLPATVKVTVP